ncbi:MAG TPA: CsbD family protein [Vicinamibacterales bacterium]|nr:CsbD family protein [Vicinamibacterales bacterium]
MNRNEREGKIDKIKGNIKEQVGNATNDPNLRDEGIADQAAGDVEEGVGKARRKVGDTLHDVAHKIEE